MRIRFDKLMEIKNSRKLLEYAQRREKKGLLQIINLAEENSCERNMEVEK